MYLYLDKETKESKVKRRFFSLWKFFLFKHYIFFEYIGTGLLFEWDRADKRNPEIQNPNIFRIIGTVECIKL